MEISEMRDFFQKIVDQVASLSTQADRVSGLEMQVQDLRNQIVELHNTNTELQRQIAEASGRVNELSDMLNKTQTALDNERAITGGLRDTIVSRDARVMELESNLQAERDGHTVTVRERDDARNTVNDVNALADELRRKLQAHVDGENHWHGEATRLEVEVASLKTQLDRIKAVLTPLQTVGDVAVA